MKKIVVLLFLFYISVLTVGAVWIPDKPSPPKLVNDLAGMLTNMEVQQLENTLVDFSNRTSTQIVLVTLTTLNGEDKAMVATEIGQQWEVGQKGFDNGIVFLIKEKTPDSKGEIFIAVGYGLEGVIPDATAKRIVEKEVLPSFRQGKYYQGIERAISTMMQLSLGEFTAKEYNKRSSGENRIGALAGLLIAFFIIAGTFGRANRIRRNSVGRSIPFWILLSMLGSGSRHRGSWGGFSSGSGSFGGGGFGGFSGGGFGGGGAGGSW
ncbi:hypothetical protein ES705_06011 [subsurface metagenome]